MKRVLLLILFFTLSCSPWGRRNSKYLTEKQVKKQITQLLSDPAVANAFVGIHIESLHDGHALYSLQAHKLFVPASNMKLYTSAAALKLLGPDFTYKTVLTTDSTQSDSVLDGNLIVHGSGDPSISGRFNDGDRLAIFRTWADSLKRLGITRIKGQLIGDNHYFSGDILADGWNWDDEPYWYSAQPSALTFNDNCVDVEVLPGALPGDTVEVKQHPAIGFLDEWNTAATVTADSSYRLIVSRQRARNVLQVGGTFAQNENPEWESISVEEPALFFMRTLNRVLSEAGIEVQGGIVVSRETRPVADTLLVHQSPPLSALVNVLNKKSHNLFAEQFLKTLGAEFGSEGSFESGAGVVNEWAQSIGILKQQFVNVDGSGLSRKNMIAPVATVTLLRFMFRQPEFNAFYRSLPIAGVDGTLKNRMRGTAAEGNVHAKTGYVRHVRSLSGYVHDASDNPWVFSIMVNNYAVPTRYINNLQDKICILLSSME